MAVNFNIQPQSVDNVAYFITLVVLIDRRTLFSNIIKNVTTINKETTIKQVITINNVPSVSLCKVDEQIVRSTVNLTTTCYATSLLVQSYSY